MKLLLESWRDYLGELADEEEEELQLVDDEEELLEDDEYPSVKKIKKDKALGKPGRSSWVHGADELDTLSKGVTEKSDSEACGSNPYRNSDGEFSSPGDAKVFTTGYAGDGTRQNCKKQSKWKASAGGKGSEADKKCGRNPKTGKKYNIRCKDNVRLWSEYLTEDGLIEIEPDALEDIVSKIVQRELELHSIIEEGMTAKDVGKLCNANGYSTIEQFLNRQNAYVKSAEGKLGDEK